MAILPIFIPHAGCPHQCVFCNQKAISGQKSAAVEEAKKQIDRWLQWLQPHPEHEAAFYGGSFTGLEPELQKQLLSLTDELIAAKIIGRVRLSTRPDYIDAERLSLLKQHHVHLVELGVQSLDDKVLAAAERGHTAAQVEKAVSLLRKFDLQIGIQLMVGMPQQTLTSVKETVDDVIRLKPDIARIYPLLVIKDTPLAMLYQQKLFQPLTLSEAVAQSAYVYSRLTENGIRVIRVGLQPDEELCTPGNIIAGPFHPAMGELVQSHILQQRVSAELIKNAEYDRLVISFPVRMESKLRGLKNANVRLWQEQYPDKEIILQKSSGNDILVYGERSNE